jgi:hypothetical protein
MLELFFKVLILKTIDINLFDKAYLFVEIIILKNLCFALL